MQISQSLDNIAKPFHRSSFFLCSSLRACLCAPSVTCSIFGRCVAFPRTTRPRVSFNSRFEISPRLFSSDLSPNATRHAHPFRRNNSTQYTRTHAPTVEGHVEDIAIVEATISLCRLARQDPRRRSLQTALLVSVQAPAPESLSLRPCRIRVNWQASCITSPSRFKQCRPLQVGRLSAYRILWRSPTLAASVSSAAVACYAIISCEYGRVSPLVVANASKTGIFPPLPGPASLPMSQRLERTTELAGLEKKSELRCQRLVVALRLEVACSRNRRT